MKFPTDIGEYIDLNEFWLEHQVKIGSAWEKAKSDEGARQLIESSAKAGGLKTDRVRCLFRAGRRRTGVIATAIWGYPTQPRDRVSPIVNQADAIGRVLKALDTADRLSAKVLMDVLCGFKCIGPSTASKILFMAEVVSEKEFAELPNKAAKACGATKPQPAIAVLQRSSYAAYVRAVCDTSRRLKVDPLQIEQFLFGVG